MATRFELAEMAGEPVAAVRTDHPWVGQFIAFTGDSLCLLDGMALDRGTSEDAGTKPRGAGRPPPGHQAGSVAGRLRSSLTSGNERKANQYGIPVIAEQEFWAALGVPITVG